MLAAALQRGELVSRQRSIEAIANVKTFYADVLKATKEDFDFKIENSRKRVIDQQAMDIAMLTENEKIARQLGIAKETADTQDYPVNGTTIAVLNERKPLYLRGYEALSKQIEITKSRSNPDLYSQGLINLLDERRALDGDRFIERLERTVESSPLAADAAKRLSFRSAQYNVENITWSADRRPTIVIVALFIGLVLGTFFVLARSALRKKA